MATTTIAEISRVDLPDLNTPLVASITSVKHLSSYNWIEAPSPTIAVPGSPPLWSAPEGPRRPKQDSGHIYIDQNAARHPDSPLEPLFRALYITNPSFDLRSVDVVTDRNNIRKLLSFINPGSSRNGLEAFTIKIEVTKNTAIFCREETATHEFIKAHEFKGYGHEFEKEYTTRQISGSTGHHRIISYSFSDLNFIVRHETDGYVDGSVLKSPFHKKGPEKDSLSSMLESLSLYPTSSVPTYASRPKLTIKEEGKAVPLESTLEIKTRVFHKPLAIQDIAPQLWISQTPRLVRAYHRQGMFQGPEVEDVSAEIKRWEEANQEDLRKLAALINKILNVVKGSGGYAMLKYYEKGDKLLIWKADAKKMLPEDLYCRWDDGNSCEAEFHTDPGAESTAKSVNESKVSMPGREIGVDISEYYTAGIRIKRNDTSKDRH